MNGVDWIVFKEPGALDAATDLVNDLDFLLTCRGPVLAVLDATARLRGLVRRTFFGDLDEGRRGDLLLREGVRGDFEMLLRERLRLGVASIFLNAVLERSKSVMPSTTRDIAQRMDILTNQRTTKNCHHHDMARQILMRQKMLCCFKN